MHASFHVRRAVCSARRVGLLHRNVLCRKKNEHLSEPGNALLLAYHGYLCSVLSLRPLPVVTVGANLLISFFHSELHTHTTHIHIPTHKQCLQKVFTPLDFCHILLCYILNLKWINHDCREQIFSYIKMRERETQTETETETETETDCLVAPDVFPNPGSIYPKLVVS